MKLRDPPPLSLYVHFPWCVRKCPYCDFNSHEVRGDLPEQDYLQALLRDLAYERGRVPKREVISVFIGGGTPSLLSGEALSALLDGIRGRLRLGAQSEITLESNPGTLTAERLRDYKHAGSTACRSASKVCAIPNWRRSAASTAGMMPGVRSRPRARPDSTTSTWT